MSDEIKETLPRVWVGKQTEFEYWGWDSDTGIWDWWNCMEGVEIFVPGNQPKPTIDPSEIETFESCKTIDW